MIYITIYYVPTNWDGLQPKKSWLKIILNFVFGTIVVLWSFVEYNNFKYVSFNIIKPKLYKEAFLKHERAIQRGIEYFVYVHVWKIIFIHNIGRQSHIFSCFWKITILDQLLVAEFGRNCQKAYLHANTFYLSL